MTTLLDLDLILYQDDSDEAIGLETSSDESITATFVELELLMNLLMLIARSLMLLDLYRAVHIPGPVFVVDSSPSLEIPSE